MLYENEDYFYIFVHACMGIHSYLFIFFYSHHKTICSEYLILARWGISQEHIKKSWSINIQLFILLDFLRHKTIVYIILSKAKQNKNQ